MLALVLLLAVAAPSLKASAGTAGGIVVAGASAEALRRRRAAKALRAKEVAQVATAELDALVLAASARGAAYSPDQLVIVKRQLLARAAGRQ